MQREKLTNTVAQAPKKSQKKSEKQETGEGDNESGPAKKQNKKKVKIN